MLWFRCLTENDIAASQEMFGAAALASVISDLESFSKTEEALMDFLDDKDASARLSASYEHAFKFP